MAYLSIDRLTKKYGGFVAVDDVSIELPKGHFLSLLGPSGSGKTTTLRAVAGFLTPDSGSIRVDGKDITDTPPHHRDMGMVFQNYALFPHLSIVKNVEFPLRMRRVRGAEARRRASAALETVELGHLADRLPAELSGGQQQRVALARAMVFEPQLLLMDEPLGALDKNLRSTMQLEIIELVRRLGATVVYVTHDQDEALSMSDSVAVYDRGRIVQHGTPQQLYERPANLFVAEFVGEANVFRGRLIRRTGGAVVEAGGHALPVDPEGCQARDGTEVAVVIRPESVSVTMVSAMQTQEGPFLDGTVRERAYHGKSTTLIIECDDQRVSATLPSRQVPTDLGIGAKAALSWQVSDAVLLRLDDGCRADGDASQPTPILLADVTSAG
ncbi:ABC transporter ATP-binding protein [Mycobacterium sp. NAZ190054]|uniref:ABC transporter ATP-binding protein n=1 Tax=Mycobacterium sp. NAZ190054 TaxID=1747766 RepID=UPI000795E871|nr:ABC transporter ATP-binding protein [Mycobacterium sp. NAZ190054]KWX68873.1 hypothetical protein ASJ79_15935 [Mycobacterium sp. NAZ190054]